MSTLGFARFVLLLTLLFAITAAFAQPSEQRADAQAQNQTAQPGNNQPFWFDVQRNRIGSTQVQNIEAGSLINPRGEVWRSLHEGPLRFWAAVWLIAVPVLILIFYFIVGPQRLHEAPTGRDVRRFAAYEQAVHWTVTITFVLLAITGLTLYFGKYYLAVLLTYPVYSWVARISVSIHNFTAPIFAIALVLLVFNFIKRNAWRPWDWTWLRHGGGMVSKHEPPTGFFNAGEKIWFWIGPVLAGLIMIVSGVILLFPVYNQTRNVISTADLVHIFGALGFVGAAFGHIYMGTIGQKGAYRAMRRGVVDETWAKEHHRLWYDDLRSGKAREASDAPLTPRAADVGAPRPAP